MRNPRRNLHEFKSVGSAVDQLFAGATEYLSAKVVNVKDGHCLIYHLQGVFSLVPPLKVLSTRLGVSRPIYVNVDSPNPGFPYFNFLGGYQ